MMGTRLGTHAAILAALLVLGTGAALGAPVDSATGSELPTTEGADNVTVVEFGWPDSCPDEGVADLDEYFDGDIGDSDDEFHLDNADGADDDPPAPGCVLRTESEDAAIHATPDGQSERLDYYPQRGDSVAWNHYVHSIDPFLGADPADFEFRFGLQDGSNYYFVAIEADEEPYELVVGEVSDGSLVAEDSVEIEEGEHIEEATFQPVTVDWTEETVEAVFETQVATIDSTAYDAGGVGFAREGSQGTFRSYTNLVDGVVADAPSHLGVTDLDYPETIAPDEDLTVGYTLENQGQQPVTESEIGLFVGPDLAETDTDVVVEAGETVTGTLTYEASGEYDDGDSIGFTVELDEWNDNLGGSVNVAEPAEFVLDDVTAPETVDVDGSFAVDYVVENVGSETDDGVVTLGVDAAEELVATDDLTLDGGEAKGGTLVYGDVSEAYDGGDELDWTVGFAAFADSKSGTATVEDPAEFVLTSVDAPGAVTPEGDLEVDYEVENVGGESGDRFVDLFVDAEDGFVDSGEVTADPGESVAGTLTFDGEPYEAGETIEWTVEVCEFDGSICEVEDSESGETDIVGDAAFLVVAVETDPVVEGETLDVTVTVENTGETAGTPTVGVGIEGVDGSSKTVDIGGGETATVEFALETEVGDGGEHDLEAVAGNHSTTEVIELQLPSVADAPPQDLTGDGEYEDLRGTGEFTIFDVQTLFNNLDADAVQDHAWAYDFNGDDEVDILDVQALFNKLG